jgi:NADPH-dependent glutamate synthase beta subunit-like oxidoreductase
MLPAFLSLFAGKIEALMRSRGAECSRTRARRIAEHKGGGGMRQIAVIGCGPAGYYTAEALQKAFDPQVAYRHDRPPAGALTA